jgi:hypothetical protein
MLNKKSFTDKMKKDADDYFKDVHMDQFQHQIFKDFVKIFLKHISMDEITAKGMGWRSVREWQTKHKRDLLGIADEDRDERIKAITQILRDHLKPDLLEGLIDKNDEPRLDKAIDDILDFYDKTYAGR